MTPQDEREARQMLADRGRFPSGGDVPFDVVVSLLTAALRQPGAEYRRAVEDAARVADEAAKGAEDTVRAGDYAGPGVDRLRDRAATARKLATAIRLLPESTKGEGRDATDRTE